MLLHFHLSKGNILYFRNLYWPGLGLRLRKFRSGSPFDPIVRNLGASGYDAFTAAYRADSGDPFLPTTTFYDPDESWADDPTFFGISGGGGNDSPRAGGSPPSDAHVAIDRTDAPLELPEPPAPLLLVRCLVEVPVPPPQRHAQCAPLPLRADPAERASGVAERHQILLGDVVVERPAPPGPALRLHALLLREHREDA